ncbi:hypothetical protein ACPWSR_07450 [Alloiococcus sp. CFN-8]|uniref:hypothetical protein n=1 Tax=Alloiococcus sp. CFN-8 TaxID=3416081 RepID=UPI003CEFA0BB
MDRFYGFIVAAVIGYMLRKIIIGICGGEFIMSLGRGGIRERRYQRIVWSLMLLFYVFTFIIELKGEENPLAYLTSNGLISITLILFLVLELIRGYDPTEIREKGVYFNNNFYSYKRITGYLWKEEDILRIYYKNIFRQDDLIEIEINDKDLALKTEEALQEHVKNRIEAI